MIILPRFILIKNLILILFAVIKIIQRVWLIWFLLREKVSADLLLLLRAQVKPLCCKILPTQLPLIIRKYIWWFCLLMSVRKKLRIWRVRLKVRLFLQPLMSRLFVMCKLRKCVSKKQNAWLKIKKMWLYCLIQLLVWDVLIMLLFRLQVRF